MLKVAVIGCGKIADDHLEQIRRIEGCKVVAACDREPLMAMQLCERFGIPRHFSEVSQLLAGMHPDVVHITTPPQSHYAVARQCLEAGAHVYVEKPFALNAEDAERLIKWAAACGRMVTVGHDLQFSHVARRMRRLVREGFLGGEPVLMESYYCYNLSDPTYAKAMLGNRRHWVRLLPGKLLQNVISHGIARIAEFLSTDHPRIYAHGFVSPLLRSLGHEDIVDELRVLIVEDRRTTASFTFSSQMRPSLNLFRIYGPRNGLILDQDQETLIQLRGERMKSYLEKFVPPWITAQQCVANSLRNLRLFLANDFQMKAGMKCLIETFYRSIRESDAPPIPYREILLTQRIMDEVFRQLDSHAGRSDAVEVLADQAVAPELSAADSEAKPALARVS
jgi:predicted dehydrogenase